MKHAEKQVQFVQDGIPYYSIIPVLLTNQWYTDSDGIMQEIEVENYPISGLMPCKDYHHRMYVGCLEGWKSDNVLICERCEGVALIPESMMFNTY